MSDHLIGCGCDECHRAEMERIQSASLGLGLVFTPATIHINDGLYEQMLRGHIDYERIEVNPKPPVFESIDGGDHVVPLALTEGHVAALERAIRGEGYEIQIDTDTGEVHLHRPVAAFDWVETGYSFKDGNFYEIRSPIGKSST